MQLPTKFLENMKNLLANEYEDFYASYNAEPQKGLRINTLKNISVNKLPFDLSPVPWCKEGYYYGNQKPGKHVYHEQGLYYIQEPSAMSVVEEMDIKNGDLVLDMCAAPGGKSTQIAIKLNETGYLFSNEIVSQRAKILVSNIERMGIKNATVLNESPLNLAKKFKNTFNKILVDAPCSGEGMFRKNSEAINEWSEENVLMCKDRQLKILECADEMLINGGRIVFSTCTFNCIENEGVVEEFLQAHKNYILVKSQKLFPHKIKGEGHFYAVLKKEGEDQVIIPTKKPPKQDPVFLKFVKDNLNVDLTYNNRLKDNLYISSSFNLDKLKVERFGFYLGEIKKGRFEPSHALALALKSDQFKNIISVSQDDERVKKYLKGETFETDQKGWCAFVVDNNPLGWVKCDGFIAKNHYPKRLRKEN